MWQLAFCRFRIKCGFSDGDTKTCLILRVALFSALASRLLHRLPFFGRLGDLFSRPLSVSCQSVVGKVDVPGDSYEP